MATKYEVIEVVARETGNHLQVTKQHVAICSTPQLAQTLLVTKVTAAYNEALQNPLAPIRAYSVRPIEIELPGFE